MRALWLLTVILVFSIATAEIDFYVNGKTYRFVPYTKSVDDANFYCRHIFHGHLPYITSRAELLQISEGLASALRTAGMTSLEEMWVSGRTNHTPNSWIGPGDQTAWGSNYVILSNYDRGSCGDSYKFRLYSKSSPGARRKVLCQRN